MTAPSGYNLLDGDGGSNPPALPADDCEDLGGGLYFTNSVANPPRAHEHPAAEDWIMMERILQRVARMATPIRIWCHGGGSAGIDFAESLTDNITASQISFGHPSTGTYNLTISTESIWSMGDRQPFSGSHGGVANIVTAIQSGNNITVTVTNASGTLTDTGSFWVEAFGI